MLSITYLVFIINQLPLPILGLFKKRSCSQTNEDDDLYAYMVQENGPESDHIYNKTILSNFLNFSLLPYYYY